MFGVPPGELTLLLAGVVGAGLLTGLMAGMFGIGGGAVIVPVLNEIFRVLGPQHTVAQRVEAGDLGAATLGRQGGLGLDHRRNLHLRLGRLRLGLSVRASRRWA